LLKSNLGSNVEENKGNPIFMILYVCLKACRDSFMLCRPIIGRDGNDHMLPLAYVVVKVKNKETWNLFFEWLIEDLGGVELC